MFIDWLPEVLRSWRGKHTRGKRSVMNAALTGQLASNVESLEQLVLPAQGAITLDKTIYEIQDLNQTPASGTNDSVTVTVTDPDLASLTGNTITLQVFSSSGDVETVALTRQFVGGPFSSLPIPAASGEKTPFQTENGVLEVLRGSQISVSYQDASNGNGVPQKLTATASFFVFGQVQPTDFNGADFDPQSNLISGNNGFTTTGPNAADWHLSTGRGTVANPNSFYFGQGEDNSPVPNNGGGTYLASRDGTLISPYIDLTSVQAGVRLEFQQFLRVDPSDTATVSVITPTATTVIGVSNATVTGVAKNLFNTVGNSFAPMTLDLSAFVGQKIQVAFRVQSNADNARGEGWYVDQIQLRGPVGSIEGTKWNDANGNGQLDTGESGVEGFTVYVDANNNRVLDEITTTASVTNPTTLADNGQVLSSLTVGNLVGTVTDVNVTLSINHNRDSDLEVTLISAEGTRVPLFAGVGGSGRNFVSTTLDDQSTTSIVQASAPFFGKFIPQSSLGVLNGENPNGAWSLEVKDNVTGEAGTLLNWSLEVKTPETSAVSDANGDYSLPIYTTSTAGNPFHVREVAQSGWIQTNPFGANQTDPNPGRDIDFPTFGGIVQQVDFYNQFVNPVLSLPFLPVLDYTEGDPPLTLAPAATITDADSLNFGGGNLTVSITGNQSVDDILSIEDQGTGPGQISLLNKEVYFEGTLIGTFDGGVAIKPALGKPLVVSFNTNATLPAVEGLLRAIQFSIDSTDPSALNRTVKFVVTDDTQGASIGLSDGTGVDNTTKTIRVLTKNDAPRVAITGSTLTYVQGSGPIPVDLFAAVTDSDSADFAGGSLQVSLKGNENGPVTTTRKTFSNASNSLPLALNDNATTTNISRFIVGGVTGLLSDVNVTLNITHPNIRELRASLIGPNGASVPLFTNLAAGGANFTNTVLDDQAATAITAGTAPFTNSFRPIGALSALNGIDPNGTWSLQVIDNTGGFSGTLTAWSIDITTSNVVTKTEFPALRANNITVVSPLAVTGLTGALSDVNVSVNINHNNVQELDLALIAPDGTVVPLVTNLANGGINFVNTTFDDQAATAITNGANAAPYTGSFRPIQPLSVLNAINPNGTWQLQMTDNRLPGNPFNQEGALVSWSLDLGMSTNAAPISGISVPLNNNTVQSAVTVAGMSGKLSDVNLTLNITHTNDKDLTATLISPKGTRVKLFGNIGTAGGRNFTGTILDDEAVLPSGASNLIVAGRAPYSGTFVPEKALSQFDGEGPNGIWKLELTDIAGNPINGFGTLDSWSLDLTTTNRSVNERLAVINQGSGPGSVGIIGPDTDNISYLTYSGSVIGTISGGIGTDPLVVNFVTTLGAPNTKATPTVVQSVIQNITLEIKGSSVLPNERQVEFILNDNDGPFLAADGVTPIVGGQSTPVSRLIEIVALNSDPVITLPSGTANYVTNSQPVVLDTLATLVDQDSTDFDGGVLTVSLGSTGKPNDKLGIRSSGQGTGQVSVSGNTVRFGTTIVGTFTLGNDVTPLNVFFNTAATPAAVQAVLRAITFQATDPNLDTAARIVTFDVTDGDGGVSKSVDKVVTLSKLNSAPVLTLSKVVIPPGAVPLSQVSYNANLTPVILDANATLSDADSTVFNNGRLTVTITTGASGRDRLGLVAQGLITVSGTNVLYSGITIGKFTTGAGTSPLTVDFNSSASIDAVLAVVRSVNFQILGPNAQGGNRVANFQVTDGSGGTSTAQTRTIIVTTANQPPVNTVPTVNYQAEEDIPLYLNGLAVSDPDASQSPIQVTLSVLHGTLKLDTTVANGISSSDITGNGTSQLVVTADQFSISKTLASLYGLQYQGAADFNGQDQLTILTSDQGFSGGGVLTDSDSVFIDVAAIFDTVRIIPSSTVTVNTRGKEALIDPGINAGLQDDTGSLNGSQLQVSVTSVIKSDGTPGNAKADSLRVLYEGTGIGQINFGKAKKGVSNLRIGDITIGTLEGGVNGKPLIIKFNSNATEADLKHLLQRTSFRTGQKSTVYGQREITFNFTNSIGLLSTPATKIVDVVKPQ